jgi:hypothetical protein
MKLESETYKGITINIHTDDSPSNPFEEWGCEPPLLTYYGGRGSSPKAYQGAPESWGEILALLPDSCFERGKRVEFIKTHLQCSVRDFVTYCKSNRAYGVGSYFTATAADFRQQAAEQLECELEAKPCGWRDAVAWFEAAESILIWGGITAVYEKSTGHRQGDVTLCLAIATPEWVEMVGAPPETHERQLQEAIELYGDWAWGNVYGFTLEDEEENELDELGSSVWGFYGYDHEKSGLMDAAREHIDGHLAEQAKESASLTAAFTF